mmetsp:Transcript_38798/g.91637  ORF Transcript_38798/g.91637 Transcript_38798/m.91637 type:complete len:246 (-) Transcript_38798:171-908(-)
MKFNVVSIALPRNNACGAIVRFVDAERALLRRGSEKLHHGHQVIFELAVTVLYAAVGTGPAIETDARAVETIASPVVVAIIKHIALSVAPRGVSIHLAWVAGRPGVSFRAGRSSTTVRTRPSRKADAHASHAIATPVVVAVYLHVASDVATLRECVMHARIAAHAGEARLARRGVILKEGTSRSPLGFFLPLRLRERLRLLAGLHRSRLVFWRGRANILASVLGPLGLAAHAHPLQACVVVVVAR